MADLERAALDRREVSELGAQLQHLAHELDPCCVLTLLGIERAALVVDVPRNQEREPQRLLRDPKQLLDVARGMKRA